MRAGAMRHRVILERPTKVQDATGQVVPAWEAVAAVWAEIAPKSGREYVKSDKITSELTVPVRIRYYRGLNATWRVRTVDSAHVYGIVDVVVPGMIKREMRLTCLELVSGEQVS